MDYQNKYLKYKKIYLELKDNLIGGKLSYEKILKENNKNLKKYLKLLLPKIKRMELKL